MGRTACTEPQCPYKGATYPFPLLVPWSRKIRAIPLLPLWAVRPVQSLSACTRVHLTPHSLLVPWSRKSRAIPLLPLWAVRPVQSLSACTRVHLTPHPLYCRGQESVELYLYSPLGRTACTEPQCLYKGATYPFPLLVPWSRKSRAIPLIPLWAVRPVQSLSACTTVHHTPDPLYCRGQESVEL